MAKKKSTIKFEVTLDENNVPEEIKWSADGAGVKDKLAKAILVSVWDKEESDTLKMDLWTKEMYIEDMKRFIHQTYMLMADTYEKATSEEDFAKEMRAFGKVFAEKNDLIEK